MLFFSGSTVVYAAVLTIGVTIVVAAVKKATRMSLKQIVDALADGAKQTVSVACLLYTSTFLIKRSIRTVALPFPDGFGRWGRSGSFSLVWFGAKIASSQGVVKKP